MKVWSFTKITKPSGTQISCTPWICWKWTQLLSFWACLPSRSWKDLHAKNPRHAGPARSEAQWYLKKIQPSVLKSLTAFHCIIIWKYLEYQKIKMINHNKLWYVEISYLFQDTSSLIIPIILWAKHGGRFSPIYSITSCQLFVRGFGEKTLLGTITYPIPGPRWADVFFFPFRWAMLCTRSLGENMFALRIWQNQR